MIEINLLPRKRRIINRFVQMMIIWSAVGILILTGLVGVFAYQTMQVRTLNKDITNLDDELNRLQETLELMDTHEAQLSILNTQMEIINKLNTNRTYWSKLLDDMSDRTPSKLWIKTMVEKVNVLGEHKLIITGLTYSNFTIADFMNNIEESQFFKEVDLVHATRGRLFGRTIVSFELHALMLI